jgi:hypothetical protein
MADGSQKRIEEVRAGERVRGASGRINVVERTFRIPHQGLKFGFNGGKKFFTDSHPFLTKQGWKSFNPRVSSRENPGVAFLTLAPGDRIQTRGGELEIHSLDSVRDSRWVYNLKTDGDHSFIADGYKVHNAAIKDTGSTGLSTPK